MWECRNRAMKAILALAVSSHFSLPNFVRAETVDGVVALRIIPSAITEATSATFASTNIETTAPATGTTLTTPTATTTTASSADPTIIFIDSDFYAGTSTAAVYLGNGANTDQGTTKYFRFTIKYNSNATIDSVSVLCQDNGDNVIGKASNTHQTWTSPVAGVAARASPTVPVKYSQETGADAVTTGHITLTDSTAILENYQALPLYFLVNWNLPSESGGEAASRFFAYVNDSATYTELSVQPKFTSLAPAVSSILPTSGTTSQTSATTSVSSATSIAATSSSNPASQSSSSSSASSQKAKGSHISSGAIAGIVVAVVVIALAVVAALVWFFCKRRRRNHTGYKSGLLADPSGPYSPATHDSRIGAASNTDILMAEKDGPVGVATSGVGERDVPHSPYTDDDAHVSSGPGIGYAVTPAAATGAAASSTPTYAAAQPAQSRSLAAVQNAEPTAISPSSPMADAISPVPTSSSAAVPPATAAGTSSKASAPGVAALIEDDMTPEDVARLEAEERQLDADIANAASRHRTT